MKTKLTSVFLCVLLSTSLGHDYHRAKSFANQNRQSHHLSHFHEREAAPLEQCQWLCEGNVSVPGGTLELLANVDVDLLGVVNVTANVALVLDLKADLVGLFNGSSGSVVIINITTGAGVYLSAEVCHIGWVSSRESFETFFRDLSTLKAYLDLNVGIKFTSSSASEAVLQAIGNLLSQLSVEIGLQLDGQLKLSLTLLLKLAASLSASLRGPLRGLLGLVGQLVINLGGDLRWLVEVLEGLGLLLSEVPGGLRALIQAQVKFDLAVLLAATNGIDLLVNFLLAIVPRVDLSILSNILNSIEGLFTVLSKLGGRASWGINGVINVVASIISLISGHLNIEAVITALIDFAASRSTHIDLSVSLQALDSVISIQGSLHSSSNITGFISIVGHLQNGTWNRTVVGNLDISSIINILIQGSSTGIELIVRVLLALSNVVKPAVAIPQLIVTLIGHLNTSLGVHLIESLIPGLSIKVTASGGIDWRATLEGINISKLLLTYTTTGSIEGLLSSIPVVKDIYAAISNAVKVATGGSISLKGIISGAGSIIGSIVDWIIGVLKSLLHVVIGPRETTTTKSVGVSVGIGTTKVSGSGGIFGFLG